MRCSFAPGTFGHYSGFFSLLVVITETAILIHAEHVVLFAKPAARAYLVYGLGLWFRV
jgi:hypothetical protein